MLFGPADELLEWLEIWGWPGQTRGLHSERGLLLTFSFLLGLIKRAIGGTGVGQSSH
ncbi:MAG: hypothetical protein NZ901_05410 [Geminocystis sp.]|nr:hypothetical protein [Geminocystis sp.]HIK38649.1 hypothetical protein [Geminocystis sp. M7585_C2015_104]MCS7147613.1 hypothetical protein [Geminocystis sp.]MCX8078016.1 hypothetical protein [Geminocystis sp.]MDW8115306.1 hypothetical protein [Geminocystis sp.]